jgi:hypothetical protein
MLVQWVHRKHVKHPGAQIELKAARPQVIAIAVVDGLAQFILESPLPGTKIGERKSNVTLALMRRIIHGDESFLALGAGPRKGHKIIPR